jgi:hypothetical protein
MQRWRSMTGYWIFRLVHGYWRWAVLVAGATAVVRSVRALRVEGAWTASDERTSRWFVAAVDVQVLLGLILYFGLSPFWPAMRDSFHYALKDRTARFFGIEHETAMLFAFIAAHVGRVRVKRADGGRAKHRAQLLFTAIFFAFVLWAIPWPWRFVGRPLFRVSF